MCPLKDLFFLWLGFSSEDIILDPDAVGLLLQASIIAAQRQTPAAAFPLTGDLVPAIANRYVGMKSPSSPALSIHWQRKAIRDITIEQSCSRSRHLLFSQ